MLSLVRGDSPHSSWLDHVGHRSDSGAQGLGGVISGVPFRRREVVGNVGLQDLLVQVMNGVRLRSAHLPTPIQACFRLPQQTYRVLCRCFLASTCTLAKLVWGFA